MSEHLKALHTWLISLGLILGAVGESGVFPIGSPWQKLAVGLGGAMGTIGGILAARWQPAEVRDLVKASKEAQT